MKFNPALVVANPGLAALAAMSDDPSPLSNHVTHSGTVQHNHAHSLVSISVNAARAANAFKVALDAIDAFSEQYRDEIKNLDEKADDYDKSEKKRKDDCREADRLKKEKIEAQIKELKAKSKGYWGVKQADQDELRNLEYQNIFSCDSLRFRLSSYANKASNRISVFRYQIEELFAISSAADDAIYLSSDNAKYVHYIETSVKDWLESKSEFSDVLKNQLYIKYI